MRPIAVTSWAVREHAGVFRAHEWRQSFCRSSRAATPGGRSRLQAVQASNLTIFLWNHKEWIIGVMEYWSVGVMNPILQHSITPILQQSITPILHAAFGATSARLSSENLLSAQLASRTN